MIRQLDRYTEKQREKDTEKMTHGQVERDSMAVEETDRKINR